jgi:hypothetical protein
VDGDNRVIGEVHKLYLSPNTSRAIKPEIMKLGRTFDIHGRNNKCIQNFGHKIIREELF